MVDIAKISMNFYFSRIHEIFLNKYLQVNSDANLRAISKINFLAHLDNHPVFVDRTGSGSVFKDWLCGRNWLKLSKF